MRSQSDLRKKLLPYENLEYVYDPRVGYIVWHYSTGNNLEVLFIEAAVLGLGQGSELYRRMIQTLIDRGERPYHSIFGYRLASNSNAERFYGGLGWTQVNLGQSIYAGDETVLMWVTWEDILSRFHLKERIDD